MVLETRGPNNWALRLLGTDKYLLGLGGFPVERYEWTGVNVLSDDFGYWQPGDPKPLVHFCRPWSTFDLTL